MTLAGKVAVVTGGAMGIGRACAMRLAQDGADVAIIDIAQEELHETAERMISETGRRVLPLTVDLLDRAQIRNAFATVADELGPVDVLNNVAGQSSRENAGPFWDSDPKQWDFVQSLNLGAVADCTREVLNGMRAAGAGRIVNVSSECAWNAGPGLTDYAAAKAGVIGFTRSLALEVAPFGITVNAVCPGVTRTRALDHVHPEIIDKLTAAMPLGKIIEPEEVAHAVSYYASDLASSVTGSYLMVSGGRTIA